MSMSTIFKAIRWGLIIWGISHSDLLLAYTNPTTCPDIISVSNSHIVLTWNTISDGPTDDEIHINWNGTSYGFKDKNFPSGVYQGDNAYNDGMRATGNVSISFENGLQCSFLNGAVLPVEWVSFESVLNGRTVNLNWTTATEENNNFFTIERSTDGINFTEIATVQGSGTSETMHNYSFTDESPMSGNNYYRLRQTDFNGQFSFSQIVQAYISSSSFSLENMYPNPAINELNFSINNTNNHLITLTIMDMFGNIVSRQKADTGAGFYHINVDISGLSAGVYFVKISNDIEELSSRFVKH